MIRDELARILASNPGIRVVRTASNGTEAVELTLKLSPGIVLMDVYMPVCDGITRELLAQSVDTKVLALTTFDYDDYVFNILVAGAVGYLTKDVGEAELVNALKTIASGGSILSPFVAQKVLKRLQDGPVQPKKQELPADEPGILINFAPREMEILNLLNDGYNTREIAGMLYIADGTVRNSLSRIYEKLNARDRVQAIMVARKMGLLEE